MTTNIAQQSPVLVLGGTGKTGRRVARRLAAADIPVRIGSRAADPPFDWNNPGTWPAALSGMRAAYVVYYPDLAIPGAAETIGEFATCALRHGVNRLVLLSGRGEEGAQLSETAVQDSGAEWTVVRASWFNQNFSEDYLLEAVLDGQIVLPAGAAAEPFIDTDDIADVVAAALTGDRLSKQVVEVTGPRLLTFADVAAELSKATGRDITYVPVSAQEYAAGASAAGTPPDLVEMLSELFRTVLDGRNASLTDGIQQALGRPARDFSDYAAAVAASGVWSR